MRVLVTGGAGFIGSNLVGNLLQISEVELVRVLDNFSTGHRHNLEEFSSNPKLEFVEGDIRDLTTCKDCCEGINAISHQAAIGSVPRSIADPINTNENNITGFLNMLVAAKDAKVKRFVYAASSSTYGDSPHLPKTEAVIGQPLSPYAVTKLVNELYAKVFSNLYGIETIGLRYFNIFGPKQDPNGAYAAVIPLFVKSLINHTAPTINGDGSHSRDFTYVDNAVQANIRAIFSTNKSAINEVFNIAAGEQTSLLELFQLLCGYANSEMEPIFGPERVGDIKHSFADITKAKNHLGYIPAITVRQGLEKTLNWYASKRPLANSH